MSKAIEKIRVGSLFEMRSFDGSPAKVLLDVPDVRSGPLIPVLVPPVAGKPKEEVGAIADALVSTGRFVVVRPPFQDCGDEAAGSVERIAILPEEVLHWGAWLRSDEFRQLLATRFGIHELSHKTACCAMSLGATLAVHAQAEKPLFDAMVLFSYIPDYPEFFTRKMISYDAMVARIWRDRYVDSPELSALYAAICRELAGRTDNKRARHGWMLIAEHLEQPGSASPKDFATSLEGVRMNIRRGVTRGLRGVREYQFDLAHNVEKSLQIDLPITFIVGLDDDYFEQETLDRFLVEARASGKVRRAVRLEDADHRMKPISAFERGMQAAIRYLAEDLGERIDFEGLSLAHIAMRRFQEVHGLGVRHAGQLDIPIRLLHRFMLGRDDLISHLQIMLARPGEVADFITLLHLDYEARADGTTIMDDLNPARLAGIFDAAIEERHYQTISDGIAMVPEKAHVLFSEEFLTKIRLEHLDAIFQLLAEQSDGVVQISCYIRPELLELWGRRRATRQARRASELVPAYRSLMCSRICEGIPKTLGDFPLTSKTQYITRFPIEERCIEGRLPDGGLIEESSGSSGTPTDWIRCEGEDAYMKGSMRLFFDYLFKTQDDSRPIVLISSFSQGTWATSSRITVLGRHAGMVKDIGTDIPKVIETIQRMGTGYHFVIAAYPPFLREILIAGEQTSGFSWKDYKVDAYHGGEGYSAGWRRFVMDTLASDARVFSGYGASDLEICMAFETNSSLAIRERLEADGKFRRAFTGTDKVPVFLGQYNPVDTYLEMREIDDGRSTIVATVNNPYAWQPRVRYEIGDEGGLVAYRDAATLARNAGLGVDWARELHLPYVFLFGRADGTISLDGANVYPSQVQEALYCSEEIGALVKSFRMQRVENEMGKVEFHVLVETFSPFEGQKDVELTQETAANAIREHLCRFNSDFRESVSNNDALKPVVKLVSPGSLGLARRIKHQYIGE